MKKRTIYLAAAAASLLMYSCNKSSNSVTPATGHTFVVSGNTFTQTAAGDSVASSNGVTNDVYILAASGSTSDKKGTAVIEFVFAGGKKPTSGSYKLITTGSTAVANGQVGILVEDHLSAAVQGLFGADSTVNQNVFIKVDVSSSGKMSATIPAIKLAGSNFDNTDPNNTVITDVTSSVSGSIGE